MPQIDLNADLGESFGAYVIGADAELLQIVSSANIACGFHGGDPAVMDTTVQAAKQAGVRIGAHPGFNDLAGFGRRVIRGDPPESIGKMIIYQIGALQAIARARGAHVAYVKLHGTLSNMAMVEQPLARAFVDVMRVFDLEMPLMAMPLSEVMNIAREHGQPTISEIFADRAYQSNGMLVPRSQPGAVLYDAEAITTRMLEILNTNQTEAIDGTRFTAEADSVCIHGDTPGALSIARTLRARLEAEGVTIGSS